MPSKPTIDGKKYIQLTDHILLEYTYVVDRYAQGQVINNDLIAYVDGERVGTYGKSDVHKYGILTNGYVNEPYFVNTVFCDAETENNVGTTVLPINKSCTKWVSTSEKDSNGSRYSVYDSKWGNIVADEYDIIVTPVTAGGGPEYVVYDIVRVYFQGGYNSEYDGFIFNVFGKNSNGFYYNLACKLFKNTDSYSICPTPVWYADKVYTNYVEFRVPSIAQLSRRTGQTPSIAGNWGSGYDPLTPPADTLPYWLTRGQGFYDNPSIGFDLHGVDGTETQHGFTVYKTVPLISTLFPNQEMNDSIVTSVWDADDGDYIQFYVYYEKDLSDAKHEPFSLYDHLSDFGNTFTLVHQVAVTERYEVDNNVVTENQLPVTYIQTWENLYEMKENHQSPVIVYRPVLYHTSSLVGATVTYTVRITNNRDNTSIIKTSTYDIPNPRRYGKNLIGLNLNNATKVHVYNRIEQTRNVVMNTTTNPIGPISDNQSVIKVNKFVTSSFIDRRNIKVRVSPVKIENVE